MLTVNETIATYGTSSLSLKELVRVILGNGEKADKLLKDTKEPLRLLQSSQKTLMHMGLTEAQANRLMACIELVRRYNVSCGEKLLNMASPQNVASYLFPQLQYLNHEEFVVMVVNSKNKLISSKSVSKGSLNGAVVHPREVYKEAIVNGGAAILVAHNHPSGDPQPSREDKEITHMLFEAGKALGIPLLDHIVIGNGQYYSFNEGGELK